MIVPRSWPQPSRPGSPVSIGPDPGTPPAPGGFGFDLAGAHPQLWAAVREHEWITSLAAGTLPAEAMVRWAQQRRHLVACQQRALAALRAAGPPEPLQRWISYLDEDTGSERRMLAVTLEALSVPPNVAETLTSLGYGCYLRCCAREGLAAGLTALYTAHCAAQHAWQTVPRAATAGTALDAWRITWTGPEFSTTLNGLAEGLDTVAAPGSRYQRERLVRVCAEVLRWERAFWDMCAAPGREA